MSLYSLRTTKDTNHFLIIMLWATRNFISWVTLPFDGPATSMRTKKKLPKILRINLMLLAVRSRNLFGVTKCVRLDGCTYAVHGFTSKCPVEKHHSHSAAVPKQSDFKWTIYRYRAIYQCTQCKQTKWYRYDSKERAKIYYICKKHGQKNFFNLLFENSLCFDQINIPHINTVTKITERKCNENQCAYTGIQDQARTAARQPSCFARKIEKSTNAKIAKKQRTIKHKTGTETGTETETEEMTTWNNFGYETSKMETLNQSLFATFHSSHIPGPILTYRTDQWHTHTHQKKKTTETVISTFSNQYW